MRLPALLLALSLVAFAPTASAFDWDAKVKKLAQGLDSDEPADRIAAIRRLSGISASQVTPLLLPLLEDPEHRVALEAARALARVGASEAVGPIAHWLQSPSKSDRIEGAAILGQLADPQAVPWLARALADSEVDVRAAAVAALGQIGGPEVIDPLVGALDDSSQVVRKAAVNVLRDLGDPRAVIPLVGRFSETDKDVRLAAVRAIGRLRDGRATAAVLRLIDDPAPEVRLAAIETLGLLASPQAIDALLPLLDNQADEVASAACQALGRIGNDRAVKALVKQLGRKKTPAAAATALATAGSVAVDPLLACLGKGACDPGLTVPLLGNLGDRRATPALLEELERRRVDDVVVVTALGELEDPATLGPLLGRLPDAKPELQLVILRAVIPVADGRAADPIAPLLASPSEDVRLAALELLARPGVGSARFSRPVIKLLAAAQPARIRLAAAAALGICGDADAVAPLVALLADPGAPLADAAAGALADLARADSGPVLLEVIRKAPVVVRMRALRALRGVLLAAPVPGAASILVPLTHHGDGRLALPAIDAVAALPAAEAVPVLLELVDGELRDRRRAALGALAAFAGDSRVTPVLAAASRAGDDASRATALWSLAAAGPRALPPVGELGAMAKGPGFALPIAASAVLALHGLGDELLAFELARTANPWVRLNACKLLGKVASSQARAQLMVLAADDNPEVRIAALRALLPLGGDEVETLRKKLAHDDVDPRVRRAALAPAPAPSGELWRPTWIDEKGEPMSGEVVVAVTADSLAVPGLTDVTGRMPVSLPAPVSYQCLGRPASDLLAAPLDRCALQQ